MAQEERWSDFWKTTAQNESLQFGLGIAFMFIFYFGIVVNIKKRKKDFDDRVKIKKVIEFGGWGWDLGKRVGWGWGGRIGQG